MKTIEITCSQSEILSLERLVGDGVNLLTCVLVYHSDISDKQISSIVNHIEFSFPLLHTVVDTINRKLVVDDNQADISLPIQIIDSKEDWEAWIETQKCKSLDVHIQTAQIIPYHIIGKEAGILIQIHHVIADGWSLRLLYEAVQDLLSQEDTMPDSYGSLLAWETFVNNEQQYTESKAYQRDVRYWQQVFANQQQVVCLSGRESTDYSAKRYTVDLPAEMHHLLSAYSKKKNVTLFSLLTTAVAVSFHRKKEEDSFFLGTLLANRQTPKERATFGNFFNTAVLSVSIQEDETFDSLLEKTMENLLSLVRHQRMSYTQIFEQYRAAGGNAKALFDVIVNWQDMSGCTRQSGCDFVWFGATRQLETLQINIEAQDDRLRIHYDYRPDRLSEREVQRFHQRILAALEDGIANQDTKVDQLRQISESAWHSICEWNHTEYEYPCAETLCSMFETNAEVMPHAIALRFGMQEMSYREMNRRANVLAHKLINMGVVRGQVIGILTERSLEMMIAIYATLKCGAAYMPIGTDYPQERVRFMLEDSNSPVLLTQSKWTLDAPVGIQRIDVDTFDYGELSDENPKIARPEDVAYIIYTSGSTGTPKGAMIQHKSAVNRISWMNRVFGMDENDVILQKTPYTFDVSVWELFWWSMYGGSLAILEPEAHRDPEKIIAAVDRYAVTKLHFVPSMLAAFLDYVAAVGGIDKLGALQQVFASGEALLPAHVQRFYSLLKKPELINLYGPTECTVDVSCYRCPRETKKVIPIGKPVDNTQLYVLDRWNMPVPVGEAGELCIGGNLVGLGYLNRSELTEEKFIQNPFGDGRLYKTGDLAKWNENGEIEYLGRIDFQVKLHGQRIELGEIERRMTEYPSVSQAVAILQHNEAGDDYLAAYYTSEQSIDEAALYSHLSDNMPVYMIPQAFMRMEAFPMTASGKIDRKKLPTIQTETNRRFDCHAEPETPLQRELCAAFAQVLGIDRNRVGINDSFFDLGGTSLSAIILLTNLHSECEFSLSDIYEQATPAALEKLYLSRLGNPDQETRDYSMDKADCELNLIPSDNPGYNEENAILLTGSTGFLGIHLLHELLTRTSNPIVCLIRSQERLMSQWDYMFDGEEFPVHRVSCVCGDLRMEHFGLNEEAYHALVKKVKCVYHAAADVRHFGVWEDSYNTNTVGTRNVIQLCWDADAQMHHVSTMSVNGYVLTTMEPDHKEEFTENNLFIGQHYADNIYVHSKYLAEKSVIDAIRKGLKANIYRLGNLLWRSSDGKFQRNRKTHDFYMLTNALLKLKSYPGFLGDLRVDLTAVDECAEAIYQLSCGKTGSIYHMINPNDLSLSEYLSTLVGDRFHKLSMREFISKLEDYRDDPIMGFMLAYSEVNKHIQSNEWPVEKCAYTVACLDALNWHWSVPTKEYLQYVIDEE